MEARAGLTLPEKSTGFKRLTSPEAATVFCGVQGQQSNPAPPLLQYQAMRLASLHALRPELAAMIAALAFGGAA